MARTKDLGKRELILSTARALFAQKGFHHTSMTDLKEAAALPVGSIYTYFSSKEEILDTIIEEGWADLMSALEARLADAPDLPTRTSILVDDFLPRLLDQADLIRIILSEGLRLSGLPQKLERLTEMVLSLQPSNPAPDARSLEYIRTAIVVYLLGIMGANGLTSQPDLGIGRAQIIDFVRRTMERELG